MSPDTPTPSTDPLAMFRDPYDDEPSIDEEFDVKFDTGGAKPLPPPEQEEQLRAQLAPYVGRPVCGARTRRGSICLCKKLGRGGRCKFHGGLSTGPKT